MGGAEAAPAGQVGQQPRRRDPRPLRAIDQVLPRRQARRHALDHRLPFPVHVVERVETYDRISRNRFVTRYAYHHGYFDGVEREFRGFGMVEQWDTEEFAALDARRQSPGRRPTSTPRRTCRRCYTKTWFHTGVYLGRDHVSDYFAGLLDGDDRRVLPRAGPDRREAASPAARRHGAARRPDRRRGARGLPRAQGLDAAPGGLRARRHRDRQRAPLHRHRAELHDPSCCSRAARNRHAVFFTHPREALSYHYEREPGRPARRPRADAGGGRLRQRAQVRRDRLRPPPAGPALCRRGPGRAERRRCITYTENRCHQRRRRGRRLPHAAARARRAPTS